VSPVLHARAAVRLVDFEASGRGDQATELADFVEHVPVWAHAGISAED
jgi:thiamine kinase-like enzyme